MEETLYHSPHPIPGLQPQGGRSTGSLSSRSVLRGRSLHSGCYPRPHLLFLSVYNGEWAERTHLSCEVQKKKSTDNGPRLMQELLLQLASPHNPRDELAATPLPQSDPPIERTAGEPGAGISCLCYCESPAYSPGTMSHTRAFLRPHPHGHTQLNISCFSFSLRTVSNCVLKKKRKQHNQLPP